METIAVESRYTLEQLQEGLNTLFLGYWYVFLIIGLGEGGAGGWVQGRFKSEGRLFKIVSSRPDRHIGRFCLKTIYQHKPVQSRSREWAVCKRSSYAAVTSPDVNSPDCGEMKLEAEIPLRRVYVALLTQEMMRGREACVL